MIFDDATGRVIDNLGWIDGGSLWTYSVARREESRIRIADANFLSIKKGTNGLFRLAYRERLELNISIRHFRDPSVALASLRLRNGSTTFDGDDDLWTSVENTIIVDAGSGQRILSVDVPAKRVIDLDVSWFSNDNYDVGYSSLIPV